jgi:hypothetical protein
MDIVLMSQKNDGRGALQVLDRLDVVMREHGAHRYLKEEYDAEERFMEERRDEVKISARQEKDFRTFLDTHEGREWAQAYQENGVPPPLPEGIRFFDAYLKAGLTTDGERLKALKKELEAANAATRPVLEKLYRVTSGAIHTAFAEIERDPELSQTYRQTRALIKLIKGPQFLGHVSSVRESMVKDLRELPSVLNNKQTRQLLDRVDELCKEMKLHQDTLLSMHQIGQPVTPDSEVFRMVNDKIPNSLSLTQMRNIMNTHNKASGFTSTWAQVSAELRDAISAAGPDNPSDNVGAMALGAAQDEQALQAIVNKAVNAALLAFHSDNSTPTGHAGAALFSQSSRTPTPGTAVYNPPRTPPKSPVFYPRPGDKRAFSPATTSPTSAEKKLKGLCWQFQKEGKCDRGVNCPFVHSQSHSTDASQYKAGSTPGSKYGGRT